MRPSRSILLLFGLKDTEKEALEKSAASLGVLHRFRVCGRVPRSEFPRFLLAADILLIPPTLTFPGSICSKLYEYLAAGVPIVSHKAGANDEILHHGKNAFVISSSDKREYLHYILQILKDPRMASAMGSAAAEDAKKYTWGARAHMLARLIRSAVH
ncbi:MAG: group 1 glycosyl transferase [Parcubacteria group bacterium Gr01-1014_70]|nr:MAG: group 1 glycosyl transferase [Parcubacteria group bacterium Gr01-1014_70]